MRCTQRPSESESDSESRHLGRDSASGCDDAGVCTGAPPLALSVHSCSRANRHHVTSGGFLARRLRLLGVDRSVSVQPKNAPIRSSQQAEFELKTKVAQSEELEGPSESVASAAEPGRDFALRTALFKHTSVSMPHCPASTAAGRVPTPGEIRADDRDTHCGQ